MSQTTTLLQLPYLAAGQTQKHVTVNESLARLDAIVQLAVKSATVAAEPASPADGDLYVLPAGKTGSAWSGMSDGGVAYFHDGAWEELTPREGWRAFVADTGEMLARVGAAWISPSLQNAPHIGVNTAADSANRLAVASAATLFTHAGAGHQHKINKAAAGDTASLLFQTAYSGRAEIGLAGDDHLRLKVSADGATWKSALVIDKSTAYLGVGAASPASPLVVNANSAAPPAPVTGTILHLTGADAVVARLLFDGFAVGGYINFRRADGSNASPAALANGVVIGGFNWFGRGATSYSSVSIAELSGITTENWSDSAQGCALRIMTTQNGAAAKTERMRVDHNGNVGVGVTSPVCKLDVDGPARVKSYTVTTLPAASAGAGQIIYVSNESGGAVLAFSDGSAWRRVTDRAVVS